MVSGAGESASKKLLSRAFGFSSSEAGSCPPRDLVAHVGDGPGRPGGWSWRGDTRQGVGGKRPVRAALVSSSAVGML